MKITDTGLVLREVKTGETSRILTLLTSRHGVLSASAKGSMNPKSKLFSASGLFCYSEWTLREGRSTYFIDEAAPIEVFFGLRGSLEALAVSTYLAELLQILSPTGEEGGRLLLLALRSLYRISEGRTEPALVKAVFEMRSLSEAGFYPDLAVCARCGREEDILLFDERQGEVLCEQCRKETENVANLTPGALSALRHIVDSDAGKEYSFTLKDESLRALEQVAERFALSHLDYPPRSLDFLKTIL